MIKAIFFDSGNVLIKGDFFEGIAAYEKRNKIKKGLLYMACHDHDYWKQFTLGKITEKKYFSQVEKNFPHTLDVEELKKLIYRHSISNAALLSFIKKLKKKYILGVISNNPKEWFNYFWKEYQWNKTFSIKSVSSELHIRKPDLRIFKNAIKQAGIKGNEALYIDDRPERSLAARQLGMKILIYKNLTQFKKDIKLSLERNKFYVRKI